MQMGTIKEQILWHQRFPFASHLHLKQALAGHGMSPPVLKYIFFQFLFTAFELLLSSSLSTYLSSISLSFNHSFLLPFFQSPRIKNVADTHRYPKLSLLWQLMEPKNIFVNLFALCFKYKANKSFHLRVKLQRTK